MRKRAIGVLGSCLALLLLSGSGLERDEEVLLFPTTGFRDPNTGAWTVPVHGWVFELEEGSAWRAGVAESFLRGLGVAKTSPDYPRCLERARWFLADNERGKRLPLRFDTGLLGFLGPTEGDGHAVNTLTLPPEVPEGWVGYRAVLGKGDERSFAGAVQLVGPEGVTVVSDLDDTMKLSDVLDKKVLLQRTLCREHEAVPGMATAYGRWEKQGASFHYVSASPYQVFPHVEAFRKSAGFPQGAWTMKRIRVKGTSVLDLGGDPCEYKLGSIEPLLKRFPERRFVLVGDSGEKDPEAYGELARRYPKQVMAVFIRLVGSHSAEDARFGHAFKDVPAGRWTAFKDPEALARLDLSRPVGGP